MSWLFIDTHVPRRVRVGTVDADGCVRATLHEVHATQALKLIEQEQRRQTRAKQQLSGVCVVSGPGTFSAVRVGVVLANLIALVRRVPLVGITPDLAEDPTSLAVALAHSQRGATSYVAPVYDAEPTITQPQPTPHL